MGSSDLEIARRQFKTAQKAYEQAIDAVAIGMSTGDVFPVNEAANLLSLVMDLEIQYRSALTLLFSTPSISLVGENLRALQRLGSQLDARDAELKPKTLARKIADGRRSGSVVVVIPGFKDAVIRLLIEMDSGLVAMDTIAAHEFPPGLLPIAMACAAISGPLSGAAASMRALVDAWTVAAQKATASAASVQDLAVQLNQKVIPDLTQRSASVSTSSLIIAGAALLAVGSAGYAFATRGKRR